MPTPAGTVYYVACTGSDDNDGRTLQTPFRTIGRAATAMQAGDTCFIRAGVYRETVRPSASGTKEAPIRFEAYAGERVIVSGCDLITRWTHHEGDIYKGEMDWNVGDGNGNIVFADGELCNEAQWPNMTDRLDRSQYAVVDRVTNDNRTATIYDEDLLAFPDGYWDGAIVACVNGVGYFMSTARVSRFAAGTLYFDQWVSSASFYRTGPGNLYFLTRTLRALDEANEWHYDGEERKLYWQAPAGSDPDKHEVEAKRREYAFDLRERSYIELVGIDCRGASITTEGAQHCLIERARVVGIDRYFGPRQSIYGRTKGIELGGSGNVLRDSEIAHFEGIGVNLSGRGNQVVNCYIHDGNLEASYASLVWIKGEEQLVSHCTITRGARTCVSGVFARSVVQYCDISHANRLTKDSGIVYLFNHDFDNSEFHHNWLHDNDSNHISFGFYMDAWTSGVNFYRNVVWNAPHHGLHMNRPIQRSLIYNNTFYRSAIAHSDVFLFDDMAGVQLVNNVFAGGAITDWGDDSLVSHNYAGDDAGLVDPDNGDFRLRADSPARGAGRPIRGVTDGEAPDAGAYAYGGEMWVPGHDFARPTAAELRYADLACGSKIGNCGFETGGFAPWTIASGSPAVVYECAWDYSNFGYASIVRSNRYAAMLGPGDAIEQVAQGLAPNTAYTFWAGIRTGGYYREAVKCDERRAAGPLHAAPDGGHPIYRDVAYVGPLKEGDWLRFAAVDFGDTGLYDAFAAGMTKVFAPLVLEVRLDAPDGELIGAVAHAMDYDDVWQYFPAALKAARGVRDVFLVPKGAGECLLQSFKLYQSIQSSPVRISVHGHGGEEAARIVRRLNWDAKLETVAFKTGLRGESAVVTIVNTGKHYVYVDDCGLWQPKLH